MRKVNLCLVWTLIFKLQFSEILSDCYQSRNNYPNIKCNFENIYHPSQYPLHLTLRHYSSENYALIKITKSLISELHENSFSVTSNYNIKVIILEITDSRMADIDLEAFVNFPHLLKLKLDYNDLTEIQQIFQTQTKLNELSLSHNNISWIDFDAFKLQKDTLKLIDLSFNNLDSTSILNNLDTFNETKSLFGFSEYLENLDISNNQLEVLDRRTFSNNSNLLYLNVSRNSLTEIKLRVFDKLSKLLYLNLSGNSISKLDLGFSIGLKSLESLDLSFNRLSVLDPNVFQNTPKLRNLQLHNNFLKNISIIDLKHSTILQSISIHDNNIDCSLLSKMLKTAKLVNLNVDEGSATESYSFHGISCNVSSTTEKSLEPISNFQNSYKAPPENPPSKNDFLENFENVFLNSTLYDILTDIKDELNAKKTAANQRNENMLVETLKEIALKDKSQNETLVLEIMRNLSASISAGNHQMENAQKEQLENFNNLQNVLIAFMKDNKAKPSDDYNKPCNISDIFNNIFLIIIILLFALSIYLSYKFLTNRKSLKDSKEMQLII